MKRSLVTFVTILCFICNTFFPSYVSACWWKGLPSRSPEIKGAPEAKGGHDDGKPNQPDDIADNVYLHNGDFSYSQQDMFIPARGISLEISRSYKSQSRYNGRFGFGWELNYNKRIVPLSDGSVYYFDGEGRRQQYGYLDGENFISPQEVFDKLTQNQDGSFTISKKDGIKYNFNADGTLKEIIDRNSNKITFTYNPAGKLPLSGVPVYSNDRTTRRLIAYQHMLTCITDTTGRVIEFSYDAGGRLIKVSDFTGRQITYGYDELGHLISVTDPAGNVTGYSYDTDRNLRSITDSKGNTFLTNTYNPLDQVIAQQYGEGAYYFNYDTENRVTKFTDRRGNVWTYYFDERGNPVLIVDPRGNVTQKTYDTNRKMLVTQITYPGGNSVLYEYDERGNALKLTRKPKAGSTEAEIISVFSYEPKYNLLKTAIDPKGNTTVYDYDEQGNLTKITYPAVDAVSPAASFSYNQYGQVTTAVDPNGIVTQYEYYTGTGYLSRITNDYGIGGINSVTEFSYDELGNVAAITDANTGTTNFEYDALNRLTRSISPAPFNYQTKYTYDNNGELIKLQRQQDEGGISWQTIEYEYDSLDRLIAIKQHLSQTEILQTLFEYDAEGSRSKVIDPEGNSTAYTYDELGNLITVTDALGNITQYSYDENRNLIEISDANQNTTSYAYDGFDRLKTVTYADGSTESYTYDVNSNLSSKTDPKRQGISYTYDSLNRLTAKQAGSQTTDYTYDSGSRLSGVHQSQGAGIQTSYDNLNRIIEVNQDNKIISYEYDKIGNRTKLTYPDGSYISYSYDRLNRLTAIKDQNGADIAGYSYDALSRRKRLDYGNNTQALYSYDNANRLTQLINRKTGQAGSGTEFSYSYDKAGNRLTMTGLGGTHSYSYDKEYQLISQQSSGISRQYNYDATGNRISVMVNTEAVNYTTNSLNQYTQTQDAGSTMQYGYDANGNLTGTGSASCVYDYENRLISASKAGTAVNYRYDGLGRRIEKSSSAGQQDTAKYIYDGDQIIAEYDAAGTLQAKYVYGSGIDEVVCLIRAIPEAIRYYYHYDGLGSVIGLTGSSGAVVEQYEYDAFGKTTIKDSAGSILQASSIGNRFMFTGREYDAETGLYYYRARYYSPELGRFLQRDPVGYTAGINLYTYVGNNPVNFVDPLGLWWSWKGAGEGLRNVGIGIGVGIIVVGATVLLVPPAAATVIIGGLSIVGAAGLGLATGQAITGVGLSGQKLSSEQRSALAVEAALGWAALGITSLKTPYWRYTGAGSKQTYNAQGEVLNKTWLTKSFLPSNKPPYTFAEVETKLQIPFESRPTINVEKVRVPWWKYVAGSRTAYKHQYYETGLGEGGGIEYRMGGWFGE